MPASPSPRSPRKTPSPLKHATPGKTNPLDDKQPAMKPANLGKAIGIDKPANVRAKIAKWQADLEGEAASGAESPPKQPSTPTSSKPKAVPLEEKATPKSAGAATPKAPLTPKAAPNAASPRLRSAKKPAHNTLDEDLLNATAPKKRVVSDSNWRKQKAASKEKEAAAAAAAAVTAPAAARPSPKHIPNAWVRPAARRVKPPTGEQTASSPEKPEVKVAAGLGAQGVGPGPRTRSARRRRLSQAAKSSDEKRPSTSGSGSSKTDHGGAGGPTSPKSQADQKQKYELVRVRRRRRSGPSPRSSFSAEESAPLKRKPTRSSETLDTVDSANVITVEYDEEPLRDPDIRERRRRSRRKSREHVSADESSRGHHSADRHRAHRRSYHTDAEDAARPHSSELRPPRAPPAQTGNRLQDWLQTTPDPLVEGESQRRRKSKGSISTPELHQEKDASDVSPSSVSKDTAAEETAGRKGGSRRRRRHSRENLQIKTQDLDRVPSSIVSSEAAEAIGEKDSELTPTPTLKRRGARRSQHSPTKDRRASVPAPPADAKDGDEISCAPSSSVDASALDVEQISPPALPKPETLPMRAMYPSRGKRLSTIASVETFATKQQNAAPSEAVGSEAAEVLSVPARNDDEVSNSEVGDRSIADTRTTLSRRSTRRNRLASHADLISVLSMPRAGTRSIVSARSIRTNRSRLATATIDDIMNELAVDEAKYMRELRTLVDGVIPVLLSCVLSKSEAAVAAGLFSRSSKMEPSDVTKPIVDMGVSLERLKSLHRRVPKDNPDSFLSWAHSAQRIYSDYINAWRLGFEDVVVSLAPADEDPFKPAKVVQGPADSAPWDEGLPRNAEGYVVNGDGERVDVAYMLKRPLVRLKYLAKTMRGINHVKPSEKAEKMSTVFQDLVTAARKRSNDERARLEDEAAANIDPTRARDPRSLAPLAGVRIDPGRCVRARDYFDMHLLHSSGQEVNCQVELLLRDNATGAGTGGDLLLCEVDAKGRWLFLPPIQPSRISARNGDLKGEIVVMIRGYHGDGSEWSEVFSLRSEDEQAGFEWVQMLGLQPVPPQISELKRAQSIRLEAQTPLIEAPPPTSSEVSSSLVSSGTASTPPQKSRTPSPHEIEIPIGEQASSTSKKWGYDTPDRRPGSAEVSPITPPSMDLSVIKEVSEVTSVSPPSPDYEGRAYEGRDYGERDYYDGRDYKRRSTGDDGRTTPTSLATRDEDLSERTPRSLNEAMRMAGNSSPVSLKRTKAKRLSKNLASPTQSRPRASRQIVLDDPEEELPTQEQEVALPANEELMPRKKSSKRRPQPQHTVTSSTTSTISQSSKPFSVWMPSSDVEYSSDESEEDDDDDYPAQQEPEPERPRAHRRVSSVPSMEFPSIPRIRKTSGPTTPVKEASNGSSFESLEAPASAPSKLGRHDVLPSPEDTHNLDDENTPPPVPPHRSPSPATPVTLKASKTPVLSPTLTAFKNKRRSSSPLKHEYEPSTATESSTESEEEMSDTEDLSTTSESSDGELDDDVPMPLLPTAQREQFPKVSPPASIYTLPNGTITPSQSASNTPYRAVPQGTGQASRAIASIFSWSDAGHWDSLHPEECSVVVTPGKIQVYEITAAHSKPFLADGNDIITPDGEMPLIALELTPLVPMRKSTAIDITIRSPPTDESRIRSGNNIMLRSRNPGECAQLYAMINQARINNPTYIALQNARGPHAQGTWAEAMDRQNAARTSASSSKSFFSGTLGRRSSYRKTSTRAASVSAVTESSVGTMNSALRSALGRFSFNKNGRFNIRGSTLGSRSLNSFDTGSSRSGSGSSTPLTLEPGRAPGAPPGITNSKCRLYERDSFSSKWRDMGSARLSIMLPDPSAQSGMREGKGSPGMRDPNQEKRIMVVGKTNSETLLDATLGESCFERVARSGIAVSVWEDVVGANGQVGTAAAVGGVSGARARVFMIQMKSERECAYCFSLLGKLRY